MLLDDDDDEHCLVMVHSANGSNLCTRKWN
jgi:hypothetical protein